MKTFPGKPTPLSFSLSVYIYLYDHSSSDKEIVGRGPGRDETVQEDVFFHEAVAACRKPQLVKMILEAWIRRVD